jgi:hypothetical protein
VLRCFFAGLRNVTVQVHCESSSAHINL